MAKFTGGKGRNDSFVGSTRADSFWFDPVDLTSGDTIVGGEGRAIDVLNLTSPGALGVTALANVSQIERVELANGGANSVVLTDAFIASANGGRVQVIGGDGDDLVYAASLTGTNAIDVSAGGGSDVLIGGDGADTFRFDAALLDRNDRISGGGNDAVAFAADTLVLSGAMLAEDWSAQVDGVENFTFSSASTLVLGQHLFNTAQEHRLSVAGSEGDDTVDVSAIVEAGLTGFIDILGNAGDDIIVGATSDYFQVGSIIQRVDGGAGADTIDLTHSTDQVSVVYDPQDKRVAVSAIEYAGTARLLVFGAADVDLSRLDDQTLGDMAIVTGFNAVDASGSREAVTLSATAGWGQVATLIGGAGQDVITGGTSLAGGRGADTLIGSDSAPSVFFRLDRGDFERGETIIGRSSDLLTIVGSVDLTRGTVTGMDTMIIQGDAGEQIRVKMTGAQAASLRLITSQANFGTLPYPDVTITLAPGESLSPYLSHSTVILNIFGSAGDDRVGFDTGYDGGVVNVHAGRGNDTIAASGDVYGEAGNDLITGTLSIARTIDGGDGNDTFRWAGSNFGTEPDVRINLGVADQAPETATVMRGIENFDGGNNYASPQFNVVGSDVANRLTGGSAADRLVGGAGNDRLDGGLGSDTLIGGTGADVFHWASYENWWYFPYDEDTVKDFTVGEDFLAFDRDDFAVAGRRIDVRAVSDGSPLNLHDVDLLVVSDARMRSAADVRDLLLTADGTQDGEGLFVVGANGAGETLLFYVPNTSSPEEYNIKTIANFGRDIDPLDIDVTSFLYG